MCIRGNKPSSRGHSMLLPIALIQAVGCGEALHVLHTFIIVLVFHAQTSVLFIFFLPTSLKSTCWNLREN